jgi:biopolymer transport protein ExbD
MKRKISDKIETPISSMIDVVFLLIIFFVVTASIQQEVTDTTIKLAKSKYIPVPTQSDPKRVLINMKRKTDGSVNIAVGAKSVTLQRLQQLLLATQQKHGNQVPIIIRAAGDITYGEIDKVNLVIGQCGLYRVAHTAQDSKK